MKTSKRHDYQFVKRMKKVLKTIPHFKTEDEERDFWVIHDFSEFMEASQIKPSRFPNLKPSTETIYLRLPLSMLEDVKIRANKRDVPYQSPIKMTIDSKI